MTPDPRHPVTVFEHALSREIVIETPDGRELARVARDLAYAPEQYARGQVPQFDSLSREDRQRLLEIFDPARVSLRYDLILGLSILLRVPECRVPMHLNFCVPL